MQKTVSAVYENGIFRPLEPVTLSEGKIVHIPLTGQIEDEPPVQASWQHAHFQRWLSEWSGELGQVPDEWWDEFDEFLQENRFTIEERELDWGE